LIEKSDSVMKFVIIGVSGHHHQALSAMKDGLAIELCGIAPGSEGEDVSAVCEKTGAKKFESWREMLDTVKPDVAVVNPWFCDTAKISMECLKMGIHTYAEKPLAIEMRELDELVKVWKASKAELGCMLNLNCCSWFRTIEKSIANGDIGQVRVIHGQKSYRMGSRAEFYKHRETYGGTIPWVGVHAIDWLLRLGGKCRTVSAVHTTIENRGHGELESAGSVLLSMENGVIGTADIDYFRPLGSDRHDDDRVRVTGTKGTLEAIDGVVTLVNDEKRRALPLEEAVNPFTRFINAIGTEEVVKLAEEAVEDTRICLLARQAADEETILKA